MKKATNKYVSPYTTELVAVPDRSIVIQYLPTESKDYILAVRKTILAKRPTFDDMKITPYFETRCKNFVTKLYGCKTGTEFVEMLVKNCGVSMSGHFRYRDVLDVVNSKKNDFEFNDMEQEILGYVIKSLSVNHVIAPKIKAIYTLLTGDDSGTEE